MYAAEADVTSYFGESNVARWSDPENTGVPAVDSDAVTEALDWADAEIDSTFEGTRYEVPLTVSATVKNWSVRLAGVYLYKKRGLRETESPDDKMASMEEGVRNEMAAFVSGCRNLPGSRAHAPDIV